MPTGVSKDGSSHGHAQDKGALQILPRNILQLFKGGIGGDTPVVWPTCAWKSKAGCNDSDPERQTASPEQRLKSSPV